MLKKVILILACLVIPFILNACSKENYTQSKILDNVDSISRVSIRVPELEEEDIHLKSNGEKDYHTCWKTGENATLVLTDDVEGYHLLGIKESGNGTEDYSVVLWNCRFDSEKDLIQYSVEASSGNDPEGVGDTGTIEMISAAPQAGEEGKTSYSRWNTIKDDSEPMLLWEQYN